MYDCTLKTVEVYNKVSTEYASEFCEPSENIDSFLGLVSPAGSILDAGCGPGKDSAYMSARGFSVTGVDLAEKMLELARKVAPAVSFIRSDLRALSFPPESFEGIFASFSLIHLCKADVPGVLACFHGLLRPQGVLWVSVQEGPSEEISVIEPLKPDELLFLNVMSAEEIKALVTSAGFSVVKEFARESDAAEAGELNFRKFAVLARKPPC